jgi:hypothetical protein
MQRSRATIVVYQLRSRRTVLLRFPMRFARALVMSALLCATLGPSPVLADDLDGLTKEQKDYVNTIQNAIADGYAAVQDVNYLMTSGRIGDALATHKIDSSIVLAELDGCISRLSTVAGILREPAPMAMRGLTASNESAAATIENAYAGCRAMLVEESVAQVTESGKAALEKLLGIDGSGGTGLAATARVTSCLSEASSTVNSALKAAQSALSQRAAEIQKEEETERELFGDIAAGMCFIATAAYGSETAAEIDVLRDFRDDILMQSAAGRDYVGFYYAASPPLAAYIAEHELLRTVVREAVIDPIVKVVRVSSRCWGG